MPFSQVEVVYFSRAEPLVVVPKADTFLCWEFNISAALLHLSSERPLGKPRRARDEILVDGVGFFIVTNEDAAHLSPESTSRVSLELCPLDS